MGHYPKPGPKCQAMGVVGKDHEGAIAPFTFNILLIKGLLPPSGVPLLWLVASRNQTAKHCCCDVASLQRLPISPKRQRCVQQAYSYPHGVETILQWLFP